MDRLELAPRAASLVPLVLAGLVPAFAQHASSDGAAAAFYKAYYLEHEARDWAGALDLYASAAADRSLAGELRERAGRGARGCAEELAATDLASLAPADTIVYVELDDPGRHLSGLLHALGLLRDGDQDPTGIGVSPALLQGTLGLRGAALAIDRVDPTGGPPGGVLILHPGDLLALRGLIETALPIGGEPLEPIGGYATFRVAGQAVVTITERLVIAANERSSIEGVLARIADRGAPSLASNPELASILAGRGEHLGFFCVHLAPIMPQLSGMLSMMASQDPKAALMLGLLDVESTRALSGRLALGDEGLGLDLALELDSGHRNVVFNLLRMPHVSESALRLVPRGAAAFAATSLNRLGTGDRGVVDGEGRAVVTWMDLGREVFGNIADVALFTLPSLATSPGGQPLPDVALAMSVSDVERSRALWRLALGVAKGAAGGGGTEPRRQRVGAVDLEQYDVLGVPLYLGSTQDGRVILTPSKRALEAACAAADSSESVLSDPAFASIFAAGQPERTALLGVSVARAVQLASQLHPGAGEQVAQFLPLLEKAVLGAEVRHGDTRWSLSLRLSGLPDVGAFAEPFVRARLHPGAGGQGQRRVVFEQGQ